MKIISESILLRFHDEKLGEMVHVLPVTRTAVDGREAELLVELTPTLARLVHLTSEREHADKLAHA